MSGIGWCCPSQYQLLTVWSFVNSVTSVVLHMNMRCIFVQYFLKRSFQRRCQCLWRFYLNKYRQYKIPYFEFLSSTPKHVHFQASSFMANGSIQAKINQTKSSGNPLLFPLILTSNLSGNHPHNFQIDFNPTCSLSPSLLLDQNTTSQNTKTSWIPKYPDQYSPLILLYPKWAVIKLIMHLSKRNTALVLIPPKRKCLHNG